MSFENATPRPWHAEGPDMFGDFNIQGPVDALAIGAVVTNMRQEAEVSANAQLIVTAVNAHEATISALSRAEARIASAIRDGLHLEGFTAQQLSDLVDSEPTIIAIREALKLAEGGDHV